MLKSVILYKNARIEQDKIIKELSQIGQIEKICHITWSNRYFLQNYSSLNGAYYDENIIHELGNGELLFIIIKSEKNIKEIFTNFAQINLSCVQITENINDTRRLIALLTGKNKEDFYTEYKEKEIYLNQNLPAIDGWKDLKHIFYILNETHKYIVLRNFQGLPESHKIDEHEDIDILVEDLQAFSQILCPLDYREDNYFCQYYSVKTKKGEILFHTKFLHDEYYDVEMERKLLNTRILGENKIYRPNEEMYFYALLFHAIYQKPHISQTYFPYFKEYMGKHNLPFSKDRDKLNKVLQGWMQNHGFRTVVDVNLLLYLADKKRHDKTLYNTYYKLKPLPDAKEEDIFCYQNDESIFLMNKRMMLQYPYFATKMIKEYVNKPDLDNHILSRNSKLRKKYIDIVSKEPYFVYLINNNISSNINIKEIKEHPTYPRLVLNSSKTRRKIFRIFANFIKKKKRHEFKNSWNLPSSNVIQKINNFNEFRKDDGIITFLLWDKAKQHENEIVKQINEQFKILKMYDINMPEDKLRDFISIFYGIDFSNNETELKYRGLGDILFIIAKDENPTYFIKKQYRGYLKVNQKAFNLKHKIREQFKMVNGLHGTLNQAESRHAVALIFNNTLENWLKFETLNGTTKIFKNFIPPVMNDIWSDIIAYFKQLSEVLNYVVLDKNIHMANEISIITDDITTFSLFTNGYSQRIKTAYIDLNTKNKKYKLFIYAPQLGNITNEDAINYLKNKVCRQGVYYAE